VSSAAVQAVVVTHAGPLIGPFIVATSASVVVAISSHIGLLAKNTNHRGQISALGSQSIVAARDEFDIPPISQKL
jgi:hypothetical protein